MEHTPVMSLVWQIAAIEAADSHFETIEPEHFFVALCKLEGFANVTRLRGLGVPESQVSTVEAEIDLLMGLFQRYGVNTTTFRHELRQTLGDGGFRPPADAQDVMLHRSDDSRKAFDVALKVAQKQNADQLAIFHLLAGLLAKQDSRLVQWLQSHGVNTVGLRQSAETTVLAGGQVQQPPVTRTPPPTSDTTPLATAPLPDDHLTQYSFNITEHAQQLGAPPGVMPEKILQSVIGVLNRNVKNNPLILTEVTHLARQLVYHLAWHFVHNPEYVDWKAYKIIQADLIALSDKITYQGEFGERFQRLLQETAQEPNTILFIDNVEVIIGSGTVHVDMDDAVKTLVNVLATGSVLCIAATTPEEYRRYIRHSDMLARLFTPHIIKANIPVANIPEPTAFNRSIPTPSKSAPPPKPNAKPAVIFDKAPARERGNPLVDHLLQSLQARAKRFGIAIELSDGARSALLQLATQGDASGTLRETFETRIENALGGMILRGEVDYGQTVRVDEQRGGFVVRRSG